jgi:hypothetical protein
MKIDLDSEEIARIVKALEHYHAYLQSQRRDDSRYLQLAERLPFPYRKGERTRGSALTCANSLACLEVSRHLSSPLDENGGRARAFDRQDQAFANSPCICHG